MSNSLLEKEREVELSRVRHNILEHELRVIKKQEELKRLEADLEKLKNTLTKKEGKL